MMITRTRVLAVLGGLGVAGLVAASAAQLDVTSDDLGAGVSVVASCDTDGVVVSYTGITYNPDLHPGAVLPDLTDGAQLTQVTVSGIAETCAGQDLSLTLVDTETDPEEVLAEVTVPDLADPADIPDLVIDVSGDLVDASLVTLVAIVITGPEA